MSIMQIAKQQILREIKNAMGKEVRPSMEDLSFPPSSNMGDVSFPCFALAKSMQKIPVELAVELAAKIEPTGYIDRVVAVGPYVNFYLKRGLFVGDVIGEILSQKTEYGKSSIGKDKKIMVEYAQPNTHKIIHVGHLRNFFLGKTITFLLREVGYEVLPTSYINDLGMHVALCVWGLDQISEEEKKSPKTIEEKVSLLGRAYAEATRLTTEDLDKKTEVSAIYRDLEWQKGNKVSVWKKTRKWSLAYIEAVFDELDLPIDFWYYESDLVRATKHIIDDLYTKGIVVESEGALIVDLEEEGLGANLLVKTDGTLLYNAKDIALALRKQEDHAPLRSLYIIDVRQSLAMQQLFATLKKMGFNYDLQHVSYEFVTLKSGAMASRKGNIVRFEDVRDSMYQTAFLETQKRHTEWTDKRLQKAAKAISQSAIVFGMLKQDTAKQIVFDLDEALSFEGHTGPYLLYTYSRISSILGKVPKKIADPEFSLLQTDTEHDLAKKLSDYPHAVLQAAMSYNPAILAQYLFDLCQLFSSFYEKCPVLAEENVGLSAGRVALSMSVRQVLLNGFRLLGLEYSEEM